MQKPPCLGSLCLPSNAAEKTDPGPEHGVVGTAGCWGMDLRSLELAGLGLQVPPLHLCCNHSLRLNKKLL